MWFSTAPMEASDKSLITFSGKIANVVKCEALKHCKLLI